MPTSSATGSLPTSEAIAVAIVIPAEGPSFGTAPAGTWRWMSFCWNQLGSRPSCWVCARTHDSAACADSCITSPSWPVIVSLPLPGYAVASNNCLSRVGADDQTQCPVRDRDLFEVEPVRFELLREEVALRDAELLVLGVARQRDDVHAVEQRRRDRVERVRRADEERLREVERQVEIVVAEVLVLLRIEDLEHRARRITTVVRAHLVDLVDQHHRIHRLCIAEVADDRARHRADVRAAMAANFRLVAHTADGEPGELS